MTSTSTKHDEFVKEPIGNKSVKKLPGIGDTYGDTLIRKGYGKAFMVLGKFLSLNKDEESFKDWLQEKSGANSRSQELCFQCLKEYCENFV